MSDCCHCVSIIPYILTYMSIYRGKGALYRTGNAYIVFTLYIITLLVTRITTLYGITM